MSKASDIADWGQYPPFNNNLIINGGFNVAQRGTSFTGLTGFPFTLDRWRWVEVGTSVVSVSQIVNTGLPDGPHYMKVDVTTADTSIGAADYGAILYTVEGYDASAFAWNDIYQEKRKDLVLSFWTAHTVTGTYCVSFRNDGASRSYVAEYTQTTANTWQKHIIKVPAPTDFATWVVDNGKGLQISFMLASGSNGHAPAADTWYTANYLATSNQVNNLSSTSNVARFAGMKLEVGTDATDFISRPFEEELALCQRYYEKNFSYDVAPADGVASGGGGMGVAATTTNLYCNEIQYKVTKRLALPTVTFYRGGSSTTAGRWAAWSGGWVTGTAATSVQHRSDNGFSPRLDGMSLTLGSGYLVQGYWTSDAEIT